MSTAKDKACNQNTRVDALRNQLIDNAIEDQGLDIEGVQRIMGLFEISDKTFGRRYSDKGVTQPT